MTPERRKYHNSISHEEQRIRFLINLCKIHIKTIKRCLNEDDECDKEVLKAEISIWKTDIKSLKKQLPVPKEKIELIRGRYYMFVCSVCGASTVEGTYCPYCGQKMR